MDLVTTLVLDGLLYSTACAHVLLAPYTKVEESFNLHATHDVIMYGVGPSTLANYDHFTFPGAVPRTFVGSVLLGWLTGLFSPFVKDKFDLQVIARLILGAANALCSSLLWRRVRSRFDSTTAAFFVLLSCSQFHVPFWMGRTIPNSFALIPVNLAYYWAFPSLSSAKSSVVDVKRAISLLVFAGVVFRVEVAALVAVLSVQLLVTRRISFVELVQTGVIAALASIASTVLVDSYFWGRPLWPELVSIYFNVVQGKSSEWGVSPWWSYFGVHLPKLLLGSLPLSLVGAVVDTRTLPLLVFSATFVGLMSGLGHKEWRFIIYVVPLFNIAAARGASWLASRRKSTLIGRLPFLIPIGIIMLNVAFTAVSTLASRSNYPGGVAMTRIHQLYTPSHQPLHLHVSNLAAQSGASLFLHSRVPPYVSSLEITAAPWVYNKTENLDISSLWSSPITHLISELPPAEDADLARRWKVVESVEGFDRIYLNRQWHAVLQGLSRLDLSSLFSIRTRPQLWILEKRG